MKNQFDPNNNIIKLCMIGMVMEEKGEPEEAELQFNKAWNETTNDFERFIAAYFLARQKKDISEKLKWLEKSLQYVIELNDESVKSALPSIYTEIAQCYKALGDSEKARINYEISNTYKVSPSDKGPFYHGTRADLQVGDLLTAGRDSNYQPELKINHIYFTALVNGAGLAAGLAKGDGKERVYIVEPTEKFENDPNVTGKKFPGNLTRSYRSENPLKIIDELKDWTKLTPEELSQWHKKLADKKGEIIN